MKKMICSLRSKQRGALIRWNLCIAYSRWAAATAAEVGEQLETSKICSSREVEDVLKQLDEGSIHFDSAAFALLLRQCGNAKAVRQGRRVHAHIVRAGYDRDKFIGNLIVQMYGKCGHLEDAKAVFDRLHEQNVYSWTVLIAAYAQKGHGSEAFGLFRKMELDGVKPTEMTFVSLLSSCCSEGWLAEGKAIHARVISCGFECDVAVQNTLVNLYGKLGSLDEARTVFNKMQYRDVISWNAMIAVYAQRGHSREALELFKQMEPEGVKPTEVTFVNVLRACSSMGDLAEGKAIHVQVLANGFDSNIIVGNSLVNMYGKCGSLVDARKVFDGMHHRNVITWNAMIGACLQQGQPKMIAKLFRQMDVEPNEVTFISVLSACSDMGVLEEGKAIHACIARSGYESDLVICNSLVNMYGKCGSLEDARDVFERMQQRNLVSWTVMVAAYAQNGHNKEALFLFQNMDLEGMKPKEVTFVAVLGACSSSADAKAMHKRIIGNGFESDVVVGTALVNMYGKQEMIDVARMAFDGICKKDVFAWTTMIAVYTQHGNLKEALLMLRRMELEGLKPNEVTFISILEACSHLDAANLIHARITESGLEGRVIVATALVNMYSKCGSLEDARSVFNRSVERDIVSWNAIIGGYAQHGLSHEALKLFRLMDLEGVDPDDVTFVSVLDACSSMGDVVQAKLIHACVASCGFESEVPVANTIINMYNKCGRLECGRSVFNGMPRKDVFSWSAMIAAYAQHGQGILALELFEQMHLEGMKPDEITFISILFAASHTGLVEKALQYFTSMVADHHIIPTVEHYVCMIDVLARLGWLSHAEELINSMPFKPDVVPWTTLLGCCKMHSDVERGARAAEELFELEPGSSSPYVLLSNMYFSAGRRDDAARVMKMKEAKGLRSRIRD